MVTVDFMNQDVVTVQMKHNNGNAKISRSWQVCKNQRGDN